MSQTSDSAIDETLKVGLSQHCIKWHSLAESGSGSDKAAAAAAVEAFYTVLEKPPPVIVWCQSPWQICAMKAALECGMNRQDLLDLSAHAQQNSNWTQGIEDALVARSFSQSVDTELWPKMWERLDAQVNEKKRRELHETAESDKKQNTPSWSKLIGILGVSNTGFVAAGVWSRLSQSVTEMQTKLLRELNGVCSARLLPDKKYTRLKQQYSTDFASRLNADMQVQLRLELTNNLTMSMALAFDPQEFPDRSPIQWVELGIDALRGHVEKLYPEKYRRQLDFYTSRLFAAGDLRFAPASLDWLPFFQYLLPKMPSIPVGPTNLKRLSAFLALYEHGFCYLFIGGLCFICEKPIVFKQDEIGRLHSESGPALYFPDGQQVYSWHGTTVPRDLIELPITVGRINTQWNAELRRVMIDRYGMAKYLKDAGAVKVHEDECGILYRKEFADDEPLVMVKVKNSSPEPDGSFRDYFLRVPPHIATAREAVAWTFEMKPSEYEPKRQT